MSRQGFWKIIKYYQDKAQIKKDAVVVGCGSYIEIWSKENYEAAVAEEDLDAIIEDLEALGL